MIRRMGLCGLAGALLGWSAVAASAEDLDSVQKKIVEAWNKHKSLSAKITENTRMDMGGGSEVTGTGTGTYEFMKQGDKLLMRLQVKRTVQQKQGAETNTQEQQILVVSDGQVSTTLSDTFGEQTAVKSKVAPQQTGEPKALFESLREENSLKVLPDGTSDGRKVYVIEAVPKKLYPGALPKQILSFDQETGFLVKVEGRGENDLPMTTMTYTDVKVDPAIDPDHFKFKLPPGVELIDEVGSATTTSQPASAPAKP